MLYVFAAYPKVSLKHCPCGHRCVNLQCLQVQPKRCRCGQTQKELMGWLCWFAVPTGAAEALSLWSDPERVNGMVVLVCSAYRYGRSAVAVVSLRKRCCAARNTCVRRGAPTCVTAASTSARERYAGLCRCCTFKIKI